jgi:CHASE3 domain sensor protein
MSLSLFSRLILSHLGILVLAGAASLYSIVQLGSLSSAARSALDRNHRLIDFQEALTDAFLSQVRYGGKYLITHVEGRREQMRQFKKDFADYLDRLKALGEAGEMPESIARIERLHRQYHELFDREVEYVRNKQSYAQSRFEQEREKIVESAINELDSLKLLLRTKLQNRIESIENGARTSRRIAIATTLVVLILGALLALKVSSDLAGAAGKSTLAQLSADLGALKLSSNLPYTERSRSWLAAQVKRLPLSPNTFSAAWRRCATIWHYPGTRKGG